MSPFELTVHDKAFARRGWVGAPLELTLTPRHNAVASLVFTVPDNHPRVPDLLTKGARVHVTYYGELLFTGPVRLAEGKGPGKAATVQVTSEDDKRLLWRMLGWPNPTGAITAQGAAGTYDIKTGPAETVLRWFVSRNATRLGLPVTFATTDQARGATITAQTRMHPLADRLLPLVDQAGIGFTVVQSGSGFVVDVYTPRVYPRTLSEANGTVVSWAWSQAGPDATRVVVAGSGEGTAREYRLVIDSARETAYGDVIEVPRDARDTNVAAELDARGAETLAEGAPKTGLKIQLTETANFRYRGPNGLREGDIVPLQVGPLAVVTDLVREVVLTWTAAGGLQVVPTVGGWDQDPIRVLHRAVSKVATAVRDIRLSR